MAEFTGNSRNILPQIMLLAALGSSNREWGEGGGAAMDNICVCVWEEGEGLKTTETERERNL